MYTLRKILGKRGRTTIPYEFRQILDMRAQDVITFSINDDKNCVVITKEKICDECIKNIKQPKVVPVGDFFKNMSKDEKVAVIAMLSSMLIAEEGGDADAS